jgi:hypothetical protein
VPEVPVPPPDNDKDSTGVRSWFAKLKPTETTRRRQLKNISSSSVNSFIESSPGGTLNRFIEQPAFNHRIRKEIKNAIETLKIYLGKLESKDHDQKLIDQTKNAVKRFMTHEIFNYIGDNYKIFEKRIPHIYKMPLHTVWNESDIEGDDIKSKKYLTLMVFLILLYIYQSTPPAVTSAFSGGRRTRKNKKSQRKTRKQ